MIYAFRLPDAETPTTVIVAADTLDEFDEFKRQNSFEEIDFMEFLKISHYDGLSDITVKLEHIDEKEQDTFFDTFMIEEVAAYDASFKQELMVQSYEQHEKNVQAINNHLKEFGEATLADIHGLTKETDVWDNRTEAVKNGEKTSWSKPRLNQQDSEESTDDIVEISNEGFEKPKNDGSISFTNVEYDENGNINVSVKKSFNNVKIPDDVFDHLKEYKEQYSEEAYHNYYLSVVTRLGLEQLNMSDVEIEDFYNQYQNCDMDHLLHLLNTGTFNKKDVLANVGINNTINLGVRVKAAMEKLKKEFSDEVVEMTFTTIQEKIKPVSQQQFVELLEKNVDEMIETKYYTQEYNKSIKEGKPFSQKRRTFDNPFGVVENTANMVTYKKSTTEQAVDDLMASLF